MKRVSQIKVLIFSCGLSCAIACTARDEADLKPFETDGCSSFPDGTLEDKQLWLDCCITHDFQYWQGGSYAERKASDQQLKQCVADIGQTKTAQLMLAGVRVGGSPYWPTRFRWGYGWPYLRGYKALTEDEQALVRQYTPVRFVDLTPDGTHPNKSGTLSDTTE